VDVISVGTYGFINADRELARLAKKVGATGSKFSDEAAKVALKTVIRNTQPFGGGGKAMKDGEGAIRSDMLRAFKILPNSARARAGASGGGGGVITTMVAAEQHLRRVSGSDRRVSKGVHRRPIVLNVWQALLVRKFASIGSAKGAWTDKGAVLGIRSQRWITRHKGKGRGSRKRVVGGAQWRFNADVEHVSLKRVLGDAGLRRALRHVEPNLRRHFNRLVKRNVRVSEIKINR